MIDMISYQDWSDYLLKIGAICEPSEWHGMTVGFLCGYSGSEGLPRWLNNATGFMDLIEQPDAEQTQTLGSFYEVSAAALNDGQYSLALLLPDDALPLSERVLGLAKWCQGYLHGLALAGESLGQRLDKEGQETLQDVAKIAQVSQEVDDGGEAEFVELVEYVRLAVFNLFAQLQAGESNGPREDGSEVKH